MLPLGLPLYYATPTGGFSFAIQVGIFFGFIVTLPIFIYECIQYCKPMFNNISEKKIWCYFVVSTFLTAMGVSFGYFVSLPTMLRFLLTFASNNVHALISTNDYFSFIIQFLLGFAIIFQIPIFVFLLYKTELISVKSIIRGQKIIFLLSFMASAILTPTTDPINQAMMAIPIFLLYEISLLIIVISRRFN
jgi:sec-independent protein translocase protein TatC